MDLHDVVRVLRHNLPWLMASVVAVLAIAAGATIAQVPEYQSVSKVFVSTNTAANPSDLSQGSTFSQQVVKSYADVATTPFVLDHVIAELELHTTASDLAKQITAAAPADEVVIEITVRDKSSARAAGIANTVANELSGAVRQLAPASTSNDASVKITQIQQATASITPSSPSLALNLSLGVVLGLLVGVAIALLRELLATKIRSLRDIGTVSDAPILGAVAYQPEIRRQPLQASINASSADSEAFRTLRASLQFLNLGTHAQIVVTSSIASEGKSVTAANLAIAVAQAGRRVLLIDADLRRPQVADYFGLESSVGVTDVLIGQDGAISAIQTWGNLPLDILPSGRVPPNPSELIQSREMRELLEELAGQYDLTIVDAPPILPVADAAIMAARANGALVVCAAGRCRRPLLRAALSRLEQADIRILG